MKAKLLALFRTSVVSLFLVLTPLAPVGSVFAAQDGNNDNGSTGNNGTLKVHEYGTASGTESNDPKVCAFNLEGFGFDASQTGYLAFDIQGGDGPTSAATGPYSFGPATATGYYASQYFNVPGGPVVQNGHYKVTLYGKDTGNSTFDDEKAKSKVFKVNCAAPASEVTPGSVIYTDVCGTSSDGYTIPTTVGVNYQVNGVTVASGFHTATGSVTVTAIAHAGYVLHGTTTWSYQFETTACPIQVTPGAVSFNDVCGTRGDTYTVPSTTGVTYKVNGGNVVAAGSHHGTGTVTITAEAQAGYVLTGTTNWSHTYTNVECPVVMTPVIPGAVSFNDVCGTRGDTYTVPSTTGVTYKVDGEVVAAGSHHGSGSVTVTAVAQPGYMLNGTESWSHEFSNEDCPTPPTDVCVNIEGVQTTVPSGMTVDNAGKCTTPAIITTITSGGQVLGDSTTVPSTTARATNVKELVNTGSAALVNLFVGLFIVGLATGLTVVSRRKPAQASFNSIVS